MSRYMIKVGTGRFYTKNRAWKDKNYTTFITRAFTTDNLQLANTIAEETGGIVVDKEKDKEDKR